jgi:hypothetical protein
MRISRIALLAVVGALVGCGGGDGGGSGGNPAGASATGGGLTGTWRATRAEYVSASNSSLRVDTVAQGSSLTLALEASSFVLTISDPGEAAGVTNGTWRSSSDTLTLSPAGMPFSWQFDMNLSGNTLTLTGGAVEFDFNADGAFEQARLNLTLVRQ